MQLDKNRLTAVDVSDANTVESMVKALLVAGALFVVWALLTSLPGVDAFVPVAGVSYGAVLGGLVTLAIVAVLGYVAYTIEPVVRQVLRGPTDLVADAAGIAKHAVLFVAVITAYSGFAPLALPTLARVDLVWTYELLFLVLGLVPAVMIVVHMWGNVDELATLVTARLVDDEAEEDPGATGATADGDADAIDR